MKPENLVKVGVECRTCYVRNFWPRKWSRHWLVGLYEFQFLKNCFFRDAFWKGLHLDRGLWIWVGGLKQRALPAVKSFLLIWTFLIIPKSITFHRSQNCAFLTCSFIKSEWSFYIKFIYGSGKQTIYLCIMSRGNIGDDDDMTLVGT